ncbi:MAG: histidinol-phosphate transaminase [Xanthomonadales bacterium]
MSIISLARPEIVAMKPYSSARKEAPGRGILLNANESPWPLLANGGLDDAGPTSGLNRYPDPQPHELVSSLANLYGVHEEQVLVTRGSDEGIDLLTRVFCRAGKDAILQCPPTFGMYRIAAQTQGADIVSVSRLPSNDFKMDRDQLLGTLESDDRIKLLFLTSPNNPTGDTIDPRFLIDLLQTAAGKSVIVLDEAYVEFTEQASASEMIGRYENLVVLRTLSKAWGAAGLRCGAVLAPEEVISLLRRVIAPYPLASPVISLAQRMLADGMSDRQQRMIKDMQENKKRLLSLLENRSFVRKIWPGEANFVLLRVRKAENLLSFCAGRDVILRGYPSDPLLEECIRISVGSKDELSALKSVLDDWEAQL